MNKVAILQSNYIPWKGYFDLIDSVDHFVIYDQAQYTKNDWRNRNKIQTRNGLLWLTIPVRQESLNQKINQTMVTQSNWNKKHWQTIMQSYAKAPYFKEYKDVIEQVYSSISTDYLSQINYRFIIEINKILGITTEIHWSTNFDLKVGQNERLIGLCKDLNADKYLSGPAAKGYLKAESFAEKGIEVEWADYSGYKEYRQLSEPFEHGVSILDLIFNVGPEARSYLKK